MQYLISFFVYLRPVGNVYSCIKTPSCLRKVAIFDYFYYYMRQLDPILYVLVIRWIQDDVLTIEKKRVREGGVEGKLT